MKDRHLAFSVLSKVPIAVFLVVLAYGCGVAKISQEQTESAVESVEQADMVKVVHYCPPTVEYRECDSSFYEKTMGLWGAIGAIVALGVYKSCIESRRLTYLDVSAQVKNRFVENVNKRVADRLSSKDSCAETDDLEALKEQFGSIKVFDFKVVDWEQIEAPEGWPYNIPSELRARLLDLEKGETLWEGTCSLPGAELHSPGDSVTTVREKLRLAAEVCADQLSLPFTV